jgi:rare lipoprotein A
MKGRHHLAGVVIGLTAIISGCSHKKHRTVSNIPPAPRAKTESSRTSKPSEPAVNVPAPELPKSSAPAAKGKSEVGIASWYGPSFQGKRAADGEIFDTEQLVAAHRTLPFNTWIKVTNLHNNRTVTVRIIDRGPFIDGRVIDLSKAAARKIEMIGPGLASVRLDVISSPSETPDTLFYTIQVGAFANYANAEKMKAKLGRRFDFVEIYSVPGRPLYRVLVGRESSQEAAEQIAKDLRSENGTAFVVSLDPQMTSKGAAR